MGELVVMVEVMSSGEGDDPQADDEGANSEDPVAGMAVLGSQPGGFASAENLAADPDAHEQRAEGEGDPSHNFLFLT